MNIRLYRFNQALLISIGLLISNTVFADFQIHKFSVNNSSQVMSSNRYDISASLGQTDDSGILLGSHYQLNGAGFWHENTDLIFKNNLD